MPGPTHQFAMAAALALAAQCGPRPALTQCGPSPSFEFAFSMAPGNPFQAVRTTTRVPPRDPDLPFPLLMKPQHIARDGQGRVELDRTAGNLHMQTGPDAGTDLDDHVITICDPVQGLSAQLDTANRTARVRQLVVFGSNQRGSTQPSVFCRVQSSGKNLADPSSPPNRVVEDLGHRTIEGFDAQGWRISTSIHLANSTSGATLQRICELWCSEDLGAVLLEVVSSWPTGPKEEIVLTKIERTEPDPSLFGIPSDYTVSQEPERSLTLRSLSPRQAAPSEAIPPVVMH